MLKYQIRDGRQVAAQNDRHRRRRNPGISNNGADTRIGPGQLRHFLPVATQLQAWMIFALVAFNQHQVDILNAIEQFKQARLLPVFKFRNLRPAFGRRNDYLPGAGLAMLETVLARMINIEGMVRMLDGGDTQTPPHKLLHQLHNQGGFSGVLKSRNSEYTHAGILP